MRSVSNAVNNGVRLGNMIGGMGQTRQNGDDSYFKWLRKQFVENAYGVDYDETTGEFKTPEWMTPPEAAYAKNQYLKLSKNAYSQALGDSLKITNVRKNILDEAKKIVDREDITTEAKQGLFGRLEQSYIMLLGEEGYTKLGVDLQKRLSIIQEGKDVVDTVNTFKFNALSMVMSGYKASPTLDNLRKYSALYAEDPKYFKDLGFPNPDVLENQLHSNARNKIEMDRKRAVKQMSADIEKNKQIELANQRGGEGSSLRTAGENDPHGFPKGTVYKEVIDESGNVVDADVKYRPPQPENLTQKERDIKNRVAAIPKIQKEIDTKGPMSAYERGWRVNDDGTLYTELDTGAAVKLPSFNEVAGKRSATKEVIRIGEMWDDAQEIDALLADPEVQRDMIAIQESGAWDQIKGKSVNEVRKYLQTKGFATGDKKTIEVISRIQEYASEKRNQLLGAAVTEYEMRSVKPWLLDASDTFDVILNKVGIAVSEGEEALRRWLDIYKDQANMAPIYKAFGIDRFSPDNLDVDADVDRLLKKYGK